MVLKTARSLSLVLLLGVLNAHIAEAQEQNDVTISTYYPSPRGVYQELRSTNNTYLAMQNATTGGLVGMGTETPVSLLSVAGTMAVGANYATVAGAVNMAANSLGMQGQLYIAETAETPFMVNASSVAVGANYAGVAPVANVGLIVEDALGVGTVSPTANTLSVSTSAALNSAKVHLVQNPRIDFIDTNSADWNMSVVASGGNPAFVVDSPSIGIARPFIFQGTQVAIGTNVLPSAAANAYALEVGSASGSGNVLLANTGYTLVGASGGAPSTGVLRVNGNVGASGGFRCNQADVAERFPISATNARSLEPGDVVVVAKDHDQGISLSMQAHDVTVMGVISQDPGVLLGVDIEGQTVALTGRVPTKVTLEGGPIKRGDLLVTASKPGYAMKADTEKLQIGMVLGKALEEFTEGEDGTIMARIDVQ